MKVTLTGVLNKLPDFSLCTDALKCNAEFFFLKKGRNVREKTKMSKKNVCRPAGGSRGRDRVVGQGMKCNKLFCRASAR